MRGDPRQRRRVFEAAEQRLAAAAAIDDHELQATIFGAIGARKRPHEHPGDVARREVLAAMERGALAHDREAVGG